ncbi:MAG TPA: diaminopimelate decarboxylase [Thermoprotei archaeon]|nr:diaminopimelate decarboxylase [Thermoprotei archaeon]
MDDYIFDGVSCRFLVKKFGTPLYVLSENIVRNNFRKIFNAFCKHYDRVRVLYAMKANSNISILKIVLEEGGYIDSVSIGEVFLARYVGFPSEKIMFTGTSVRDDELDYLIQNNITINIDSLSELDRLLRKTVPDIISIRVNLNIGAGHHEYCITGGYKSKFGIWEEYVLDAYKKAFKKGVREYGIHTHIGSNILDPRPLLIATERLLDIAGRIRKKLGIKFKFIDIGGGIGIPYRPKEKEFNIDLFAENIVELFKRKIEKYDLGQPYLYIEPGRYIVGSAGILLTRVNTVKENPYKTFIGVDAGMNILLRPALYNAYHPIIVLNSSVEEEIYDIVGPLCESGDFIARNRKLPKIKEGDILVVLNTGAYGFSMSSHYNSRLLPAEILVNNGKYDIVREREDFRDLLRHQRYAEWLKGNAGFKER